MNHSDSATPQDVVIQPRDGATYSHQRDGKRLHHQHHRVLAAMRDGLEHTLAELHAITGDPEASISARLRDLRKPRFGSHDIQGRFIRRGLWTYRLLGQGILFEHYSDCAVYNAPAYPAGPCDCVAGK